MNKHGLGSWRPELPDHRDKIFRPSGRALADVVPSLGKTRGTRIHDQGMTSSCTGHAGTTALEVSLGLSGDTGQLSRAFAYYKAREFIGETKFDNGAYCRDIFKGFVKFGCPHESRWPFKASTITKPPSVGANAEAQTVRGTILSGLVYESCSTLPQILGAINEGFPVMFGFTCYQSIFDIDSKDYTLKMPGPRDAPIGGHAVVADGYDIPNRVLWIENSWGIRWANGGRFLMPFDYIEHPSRLADDFWIIKRS